MPKFKLPKLPKNLKNANLLMCAMALLLVVAAFYIGSLTTELKYLRGGTNPTDDQAALPTEEDIAELARNVERPSSEDHILGNKNAKIALIEYTDYECPFCRQFHPSAQQIVADMGDSVMWVLRHFPLDQIHPFARPAALAGECVAELVGEDAFWNFTDTVFENQDLLSLSKITDWALATGVNAAAYDACIESPATVQKVETDVQSGIAAGVNGTPGNIVINLETGEVVVLPGAVPVDQVRSAIESLQ